MPENFHGNMTSINYGNTSWNLEDGGEFFTCCILLLQCDGAARVDIDLIFAIKIGEIPST